MPDTLAKTNDDTQRRLDNIDSKIEINRIEIERLHKGETRTFKITIASIGVMVGIGGLFIPVYNLFSTIRANDKFYEESKRQEERVSRLILDTEKTIDRYTGSLKVDSARLTSTNSNTDLIDGRPEISKIKIDNIDTMLYETNVKFYINAEINGGGIGKIIGIRVKYSGKIVQILNQDANNRVDNFASNFYNNGVTYYYAANVVEGFPVSLNWTMGIRRKSCFQAFEIVNDLTKNNNLGYVEITPILESVKNKPISSKLKISVDENPFILTCDEIENKKPDKFEASPRSTPPSTSSTGENKN